MIFLLTVSPAAAQSGVTVNDVIVDFANTIDVPARTSGVVAELLVKRNQAVRKSDVLAKLDDTSLTIQRRAALLRYESARLVLKDDLEIRFAETSLAETEAELDDLTATSDQVSGAVPRNQMRRTRLAVQRAKLELDRAEKQRRQAEIDLEIRAADMAAIDQELTHRQCVSPIDGIVLATHCEPGEWAQAGTPLVTIANTKTLHLHALVATSELDPNHCIGLPVSVMMTLPKGNPAENQNAVIQGKVISVDPTRLPGGRFRLHAEVSNSNGVLVPGMKVSMRISNQPLENASRAGLMQRSLDR